MKRLFDSLVDWADAHPKRVLAIAVAVGLAITFVLQSRPPPALPLTLTPVVADVLGDPGTPRVGPADADVVVVLYTDYRCPICRDTGYVGEPVHELCACMKQRIMDAENAGEHKGGLGRHSFAQFDLNVFPDVPIPGEKRSQRDHMRLILRAAQRYAEDFPDNEKPNLIFFGAAGLGKTFVADCIAQRIMERAYLVRRVTAYRLCEIMRKNQFDGSEARAVEGVMDCDLLFIDDLGTEPQTKNTSGYLFQVINERNMNDRHTIISTNLNPERMEGMYEQRVASRLMDVSRTTAIRFYGEDLRLRK